ncbi:hypothetical protein [Streptomyces sp. NPDC091027]|uniref:hypothetical protein n=1 Tax=Streptomyces sp. NPDC091027 TaxID=3365971 RepID=UPI0038232245
MTTTVEISEDYVQAFTLSALQSALWADAMPDEEDGEMGLGDAAQQYDLSDMDEKSREEFLGYCRDFCVSNFDDLADISPERAGHDFWMTSQGHGCGFWDGDYPAELGDRLTQASKPYHFDSVWVWDSGIVIE